MIIVIAPFESGEYYQKKINNDSSVHHSLRHLLLRTQESDSGVQNPIGEADFKWILQCNCEGTEQLQPEKNKTEDIFL